GQRGRALLELLAAHLGEVRDRRDEQLGLAREVMEERAARDAGLLLDLERRRAGEAVLDQALDRGVEQRAARLVAALRLRARGPGGDGHGAGLTSPRTLRQETVSQDGRERYLGLHELTR